MSHAHPNMTPPKLTPAIVRRIKHIYAYNRRERRWQGKSCASFGLRKNMADRVFAWTGIRVSTNTIKAIVDGRRWGHVKLVMRRGGPRRKKP